MATEVHKFQSERPTAGSILFNLTKSGKAVQLKTVQAELKKQGQKITNMDNRIYWFKRIMARDMGKVVEYDAEKGTLKIVGSVKAKKSTAKKAVAKKPAKRVVTKKTPAAVAVASDSDENSEV